MQLDVTFKQLKPKEEVRRRASALYQKLERFLDPAAEGHLVCTLEHGGEHRTHGITEVELTVTTRGQTYVAKDADEDLRTAMDRAFHTLENALRRAKDRRVSRQQEGPAFKDDGFWPDGPVHTDEQGEAEFEAE